MKRFFSKLVVQDTCVDNPYFANCKLIVKARYCGNKYYAKFCCRSCTLAGDPSTLSVGLIVILTFISGQLSYN